MVRRSRSWRLAWQYLLSFGEDADDSPEIRERKRLVLAVLWISIPVTFVWVATDAWQGAVLAAWELAAVALVQLAVLSVVRVRPSRFWGAMHVAILNNNLGSLAQTLLFGGLPSSRLNMVWGFLGVLGALVGFGYRVARYWLAAFALSVVASAVAPRWIRGLYTLPDPGLAAAANLVAVGIFVFMVLEYFVRQRDRFQKQSDDLLRNILPDQIAERLKRDTGMIAERFENASILFADVVDFTPCPPTSRLRISWRCSTKSSVRSTSSSIEPVWRRSRRSETAIWSPGVYRARAPTTRTRWLNSLWTSATTSRRTVSWATSFAFASGSTPDR